MSTSLLNRGATAYDIPEQMVGAYSAAEYYTATLTGNISMDATYPRICKLDPGGSARDVTLDAEEYIPHRGMVRHIVNAADAAENIVVKNDAGDTIGTLNQNEEGLFHNAGVQDGTASAWTLIRIATIALS